MLTHSNRTNTPNRPNRRRPFAVAIATVVAVLGLSGCSLIPAGWSVVIGSAIEVTAYFDDVAGLYESNDVDVLGMPVGQVTGVQEEGNRVKVTFTVDKDVPVPADATAAIVNTSIVTTRHIELTPAYTEGAKLTDGAVIQETKSPVSAGELYDSIDGLVKALSGDSSGGGPVADLVDITSGIASGNGEAIRDAISELGQAASLVSDNGDTLVSLIKTVQSLTTTLVDNYPKMTALSRSINEVARMLQVQAPGLQATLADLNVALANTTAFLQNNVGTISASTSRLAALVANLSDFSRQVVETIDVGPLLFQNLANSVSVEQGAWRAQVLLDKSLIDSEALSTFCQALNLQENGCRTGQLEDFGPDLGVFSALLELTK
ncbi:MCE family protein [Gordonia rhizosphera]|uniref:Mce family protein n=1 Tax=Gordonia rhizosphera NBRC 16068 TaxID=1108045 RepID=K6WCH3_9ACTN|nr:MCE family protein [Gordonia rhizosphera]GAB89882.1 Mce family protein [Gordonia rhizosphera NBRC 16068]